MHKPQIVNKYSWHALLNDNEEFRYHVFRKFVIFLLHVIIVWMGIYID